MKYPKIQTLWKRDPEKKYTIMEGEYSKEEFKNILKWNVTEKIDGTNIRVISESITPLIMEKTLEFRGRTDKAQIPKFLLDHLEKTFSTGKLTEVFDDYNLLILYGEGYGGKMQKVGKLYRDESSFILFDVWIDGWWMERENVVEVAEKLGIDVVPSFSGMTKFEIVEYVKSKPKSSISKQTMPIEGIVARSEPLMLFRNGNPMMFKLKVEDYEKLDKFGDDNQTQCSHNPLKQDKVEVET